MPFSLISKSVRFTKISSVTQTPTKNTDIIIKGEQKNAELCSVVLNKLLDIISSGEPLDKTRIIYCIEMAREGNTDGIEKVMSGVVAVTSRGKQIKCKTLGQKK